MTSDEIKGMDLLSGYITTPNAPTVTDRKILELLREILLQLAVMNERAARPEELELAKLQRGGNQPR